MAEILRLLLEPYEKQAEEGNLPSVVELSALFRLQRQLETADQLARLRELTREAAYIIVAICSSCKRWEHPRAVRDSAAMVETVDGSPGALTPGAPPPDAPASNGSGHSDASLLPKSELAQTLSRLSCFRDLLSEANDHEAARRLNDEHGISIAPTTVGKYRRILGVMPHSAGRPRGLRARDAAEALVRAREKAGLTQAQLEREAGGSGGMISRLEGVWDTGVGVHLADRIASVLGCAVDELFTDDSAPPELAGKRIRPPTPPSERFPGPHGSDWRAHTCDGIRAFWASPASTPTRKMRRVISRRMWTEREDELRAALSRAWRANEPRRVATSALRRQDWEQGRGLARRFVVTRGLPRTRQKYLGKWNGFLGGSAGSKKGEAAAQRCIDLALQAVQNKPDLTRRQLIEVLMHRLERAALYAPDGARRSRRDNAYRKGRAKIVRQLERGFVLRGRPNALAALVSG